MKDIKVPTYETNADKSDAEPKQTLPKAVASSFKPVIPIATRDVPNPVKMEHDEHGSSTQPSALDDEPEEEEDIC